MKQREFKFRALREGRWLYFTGIFNDTPVRFDADTLGQFTGLHDKDGRPVYEGDVVRHRSNGGTWSPSAEVKWRDTAFELAMVPMRNIVFPRTEVEIIGNIYENPELLRL